jgi:hypothetical protein
MAHQPPRPGIWQAEVFSRINELRGRLSAAETTTRIGTEAEEKAIHKAVETSLDTAETAANVAWWRRPKAWWTGSAITEAWEGVHHAELALIGIEGEESVRAILARLLAWIQSAIEEPERRERHEKALKKELEGSTVTLNRTVVRQAFVDVIAANRERYGNLRTFRNILILVSALLTLLVVGVSVWHALNPAFLTLCPAGAKICLTSPPKTEVAIVALLGAIGGSLGLAFGLAEADAAPSRYDPKAWQALLKPVTGAVTGVLGIMLIQAGFLVEPAGNANYALLVYAVIFGFSQQLLTRTVDKQANALVNPGKTS